MRSPARGSSYFENTSTDPRCTIAWLPPVLCTKERPSTCSRKCARGTVVRVPTGGTPAVAFPDSDSPTHRHGRPGHSVPAHLRRPEPCWSGTFGRPAVDSRLPLEKRDEQAAPGSALTVAQCGQFLRHFSERDGERQRLSPCASASSATATRRHRTGAAQEELRAGTMGTGPALHPRPQRSGSVPTPFLRSPERPVSRPCLHALVGPPDDKHSHRSASRPSQFPSSSPVMDVCHEGTLAGATGSDFPMPVTPVMTPSARWPRSSPGNPPSSSRRRCCRRAVLTYPSRPCCDDLPAEDLRRSLHWPAYLLPTHVAFRGAALVSRIAPPPRDPTLTALLVAGGACILAADEALLAFFDAPSIQLRSHRPAKIALHEHHRIWVPSRPGAAPRVAPDARFHRHRPAERLHDGIPHRLQNPDCLRTAHRRLRRGQPAECQWSPTPREALRLTPTRRLSVSRPNDAGGHLLKSWARPSSRPTTLPVVNYNLADGLLTHGSVLAPQRVTDPATSSLRRRLDAGYLQRLSCARPQGGSRRYCFCMDTRSRLDRCSARRPSRSFAMAVTRYS